jgi:hypothetical protein
MERPVDALGLGPTRRIEEVGGLVRVTVTPPAFAGLPPRSVDLTPDQYAGYRRWLEGTLIQDALPDLSPAEREILMTGIGDEDFRRIATEEDR